MFVKKSLSKSNPNVFHNYFTLLDNTRPQTTRGISNHHVKIPLIKTENFGRTFKSTTLWNEISANLDKDLYKSSFTTVQKSVTAKFVNENYVTYVMHISNIFKLYFFYFSFSLLFFITIIHTFIIMNDSCFSL